LAAWLSWFLSPGGIVLLAALDSSVAFFLPLANDVAVIYLAAGDPNRYWLYAVLAAVGSVAGAASTYWVGWRVGEDGLEKWLPKNRLELAKRKVKEVGALALAVPAIIPPPFPFTPFVLTSGALEVDRRVFFPALAAMRFARFLGEAFLAHLYGKRLLGWMHSRPFEMVIWGFILVAVAGSAWSIYRLVGTVRSGSRPFGPGRRQAG
jgi:membrane protein YqaA with SNARE-associated domain